MQSSDVTYVIPSITLKYYTYQHKINLSLEGLRKSKTYQTNISTED